MRLVTRIRSLLQSTYQRIRDWENASPSRRNYEWATLAGVIAIALVVSLGVMAAFGELRFGSSPTTFELAKQVEPATVSHTQLAKHRDQRTSQARRKHRGKHRKHRSARRAKSAPPLSFYSRPFAFLFVRRDSPSTPRRYRTPQRVAPQPKAKKRSKLRQHRTPVKSPSTKSPTSSTPKDEDGKPPADGGGSGGGASGGTDEPPKGDPAPPPEDDPPKDPPPPDDPPPGDGDPTPSEP